MRATLKMLKAVGLKTLAAGFLGLVLGKQCLQNWKKWIYIYMLYNIYIYVVYNIYIYT